MLDPSPILEAVDKVLEFVAGLRAAGHAIRYLDLGGGLGVAYHPRREDAGHPGFVESLDARLRESGLQ